VLGKNKQLIQKQYVHFIFNELKSRFFQKLFISTAALTDSPTTPKEINHSDATLNSCLLRTESLSTGIFANQNDRYPPEGNEATRRTSDVNDQFILCSKQAPQPILIKNAEEETKSLVNTTRDRLPSFSSQISQATDESDDTTGSLHALSDEQLDHLASLYHPFSSELSSETGMHNRTVEQSKTIISESFLY